MLPDLTLQKFVWYMLHVLLLFASVGPTVEPNRISIGNVLCRLAAWPVFFDSNTHHADLGLCRVRGEWFCWRQAWHVLSFARDVFWRRFSFLLPYRSMLHAAVAGEKGGRGGLSRLSGGLYHFRSAMRCRCVEHDEHGIVFILWLWQLADAYTLFYFIWGRRTSLQLKPCATPDWWRMFHRIDSQCLYCIVEPPKKWARVKACRWGESLLLVSFRSCAHFLPTKYTYIPFTAYY